MPVDHERKLQKLIEAYDRTHKPHTLKHLSALKAAVEQHPLDYRLWVRYMECMLHGVSGLEANLAVEKEVREIYENIDQNCANDSIRMRAKRIFVMYLHGLAQIEPARQAECEQILDEMPAMRTCREHIATMVMLGEAQQKANRQLIDELLWMLLHAMFHQRSEMGRLLREKRVRVEKISVGDETLQRAAKILFADLLENEI